LVIAPDDPTLPGLPRERETLKRYVAAGGSSHGILADAGLSPSRVCELLAQHNIVHFACHGFWDKDDPHRTGFRLGPKPDQYLSVRDLARLDLPRAELAFLSACNTAMTLTSALQMLDEGLTLATSLHVAGFRNVVGPWWPVNDLMALRMMRTTYTAMEGDADRIDPQSSATALRTSVLGLRSRNPKRPSLWAAHVHIGG
jgi:CHAT domain-containing protein